MAVVRIDRSGMGALVGLGALPGWVAETPGVSSFGRTPVGVSSFGRTPIPGGAAPAVKPSPAAAASRVSSSVALVGKAAAYSLAPAPKVDCGPPPPGAEPDASGAIRFSVDPKIVAWRACDRANAAPVAKAAAESPAPKEAAPATPLGPYEGPGAAYGSPSKPAPYTPDSSIYEPIRYEGPGGGGAGGGGGVPGSSDLTKGASGPAAASVSSTGLYVAGGVVALVAGLGLWLALK